MTLPNQITVSRIVGTPVFYLIFVALKPLSVAQPLIAKVLVVFLFVLWIVMEVSDVVDGYIARKHNLVSDMGKLLDPFSDVLSRITYFFCFAQMGVMPWFMLLIIFWRELSITFIRAVMATGGVTLAANKGGKTKALFYFMASLWGMVLMVAQHFISLQTNLIITYISWGLFGLATLASVTSFIGYLKLFFATPYAQKFLKEKGH